MRKISAIADFNFERVLTSLSVDKSWGYRATCVQFIFDKEWEKVASVRTDRAGKNLLAIQQTITRLKAPLEFLDHHAPLVFDDHDYNHDALEVAIVTGSFLPKMVIPDHEDDINIIIKDVPNAILRQAKKFIQNAHFLMSGQCDPCDCSTEAAFLAHMFAMVELNKVLEETRFYRLSEMEKILETLPDIKNFIDPAISIGEQLCTTIKDVETKFANFNGSKVLKTLGIKPEQKSEAQYIGFLFKQKLEMFSEDGEEDPYKLAHDCVLEETEYPLSLMRTFESSFFNGQDYHRDALILALICNDDDLQKFKMKIDIDLIRDADQIESKAREIIDTGRHDSSDPGGEDEAVFFAHILTISKLQSFLEDIDNQSPNDIRDMKTGLIHARRFVRKETAIGQKLAAAINDFDEEVLVKKSNNNVFVFPAPGMK